MLCKYYEIITSYFDKDFIALQSYQTSKVVTYKTLSMHIGFYQAQLKEKNVVQGDKVVIVGQNGIAWCAAYLAVQLLGAVVVPLSRNLSFESIIRYGQHCNSNTIVTDIRDSRVLQKKYNIINFQDNICDEQHYLVTCNSCIQDSDICSIVYTSGTTEQPKGVMLSFKSLSLTLEHALTKMPLQRKDRFCSCLPFEHAFGCMYNMLYPLAAGANNLIIDAPLSVSVLIDAFTKYHPKILYSVPLFIEKIYAKTIKETSNSKEILNNLLKLFGGKIQDVLVGGAALNPEIERQLVSVGFPLGGGYGMTECGPTISYASSKEHVNGSVGYVVDYMETKIRQLNQDGSGELLVRGDNVFHGYYKDIASTKKVLDADGWLHTGDVVRIEHTDKGRLLYIVGRCKNMILRSNGENVYPEEIESMINCKEGVESALAISRGNLIVVKVHFLSSLDKQCQERLLSQYLDECNAELPKYMKIDLFELQEDDFARTEKKTIKRYLYN